MSLYPSLRDAMQIVEAALATSLIESHDVNGARVFTRPSFAQLVGLCRRHGEIKGWVSTPTDDLSVWDAHALTHMDVAADTGDVDLEDPDAELPGYAYSFTSEGVEATSEWQGHPYIEGNGLRIYHNSEQSLTATAILRLKPFMGEIKIGDWTD